MKLLIARHGEPDYEHDSLTRKGAREAEYLAQRLETIEARAYFVSPLGRAKATAAPTLERLGRTAQECSWLREFEAPIYRPDVEGEKIIPWDWLPQDWMREEAFFREDMWFTQERLAKEGVKREYDRVTDGLDALLCDNGYRREGRWYRAEAPHNSALVFFCHFGVECVLLSHLLNISPMVLWHGFCAAPASLTTVVTEERRPGIASFRVLSFGDVSHLYVYGEEPAFAARFRECYQNEDQRRD